jgi:acyl-homoserine-lactone acylase
MSGIDRERQMTRLIALIGLCGLIAASGCSSDSSSGGGGSGGTGGGGGTVPRDYSATIVRTTYGVPHIKSDNYGDLGFGAGYAYAQDNYCLLLREIVFSNGQSARYFGEEDGDIDGDYVYTFFNSDEMIEEGLFAGVSEDLLEALTGYAAGFNKYLEVTGADNLPEACRNGDWIRPIDLLDMGKVIRKLILEGSTANFPSAIMSADPPAQSMARLLPQESVVFDIRNPLPEVEEMGSNGYGIGSESSQTEYGLQLGNPHFPWRGNLRFYMLHLTIPGQLDAMGATITGIPIVLIGFNQNVAWSHTVSTGNRFTLYEVKLVDDDPMRYQYDGEERDIEAVPVTIQVKLEDGTLEDRSDAIYFTHYGPIINGGLLSPLLEGWPNPFGSLLTYRDANLTNNRAISYWEAMDKSQSIDDLEEALKIIGNPWTNTIAADRNGEALYADVSVVPNVSTEQLNLCNDSIITMQINDRGFPALNGSKSECEWGSDEDAPEDGIFGYGNLPKLRTREYVGNSNDSYWLSNPDQLTTGFSVLIGREEYPQSLRTRQGFTQAEARMAATDGKSDTPGYDLALLQDMLYSDMDIAEQMTRTDVLALCDDVLDWSGGDCDNNEDTTTPYSQNPAVAATACGILQDWDGLYQLDSVGSSLWREFWGRVGGAANLWAVPFDATDPVNTPNTLNVDDDAVVERVRCSIGGAVDRLVTAGVALDLPWGEAQYRPTGDGVGRTPIHGGNGQSTFSVIGSRLVDGEGYSDIPGGNSYIHTVTWDETQCPDAFAVLTYSQSENPASPHYSDMTQLYSEGGWNDMPFCPEDIEAEKISEIEVSTN